MRAKLMLWGAAVNARPWIDGRTCERRRGEIHGPIGQGLSAGQDASGKAKIKLQGGDVVTVIGPGSAQDPARPGQFRRQAGAAGLGRRPARPVRRASRDGSRAQPEHLGRRRQPERQGVRQRGRKLQLWRPDNEAAVTVNIHSADGKSRAELGCGQGAGRLAGGAAGQERRRISGRMARTGDKSSLDIVTIPQPPPADLVGAAQVLIENGCQRQLDLLVDSASKAESNLADDALRP